MNNSQLIPPGYKQTEVGVIPEDWGVSTVGAEFSIQLGKMLDAEKNVGVPKPFLGNRAVQWGRIDLTDIGEIKLTPSDLQRFRLRKGDLLVCEGGEIGRAAVWQQSIEECYYQKALHRLRPIRGYNVQLMFNMLQRLASTGFLLNFVTQTSIAHLPKDKFETVPIPVPPTIAEQEAIAEALSDADALIESLKQLLGKKRLLKQGAMQELLTGKKRLPGFEINPGYKQTEVGVIPEDWETPELGDVLKSTQLGGNYKNSERETSWPLIKMGNLGRGSIKLDKLEFIDPSQSPTSRDRLRKDDVLFNTRNTLDLVGKVALWRDELPEAFFNSNIMRMEFNEARVSSKRFMNYILNTPQSLTRLRGIAIGTTSVAAIYGRDLVKVKVPLPTGTEQEALAALLSDMDADLAALETKLTKARQIKQGMMQELLTGRIRLVESGK